MVAMNVLQELQQVADELAEVEDNLGTLRQKRATLIHKARLQGESWRVIAAEAKMTEHGLRKTLHAWGYNPLEGGRG
jgi:hypothetical protein